MERITASLHKTRKKEFPLGEKREGKEGGKEGRKQGRKEGREKDVSPVEEREQFTELKAWQMSTSWTLALLIPGRGTSTQ